MHLRSLLTHIIRHSSGLHGTRSMSCIVGIPGKNTLIIFSISDMLDFSCMFWQWYLVTPLLPSTGLCSTHTALTLHNPLTDKWRTMSCLVQYNWRKKFKLSTTVDKTLHISPQNHLQFLLTLTLKHTLFQWFSSQYTSTMTTQGIYQYTSWSTDEDVCHSQGPLKRMKTNHWTL